MTSSMNKATIAWPYRNLHVWFYSAFACPNTVTIRLAVKYYKFVIFNIHEKQEILLGYVLQVKKL